jgi:hypothetical protein
VYAHQASGLAQASLIATLRRSLEFILRHYCNCPKSSSREKLKGEYLAFIHARGRAMEEMLMGETGDR